MAHKSPYLDKNGTRLPGVTTITGELGWNKQVLISWANKLGLKGIESSKFVDDKASIGTLAHQFVLDYFRKAETPTADYSENQIKAAKNCLASFMNWINTKAVEPILLETPLISEKLSFGGTMDYYGKVDGKLTLLDFKTGKGIYSEYFIQVAGGYLILLEENGHKIEDIQILNIPRSDDEAFQIQPLNAKKWGVCKQIFLNCLDTYKLKKLLKEDL